MDFRGCQSDLPKSEYFGRLKSGIYFIHTLLNSSISTTKLIECEERFLFSSGEFWCPSYNMPKVFTDKEWWSNSKTLALLILISTHNIQSDCGNKSSISNYIVITTFLLERANLSFSSFTKRWDFSALLLVMQRFLKNWKVNC